MRDLREIKDLNKNQEQLRKTTLESVVPVMRCSPALFVAPRAARVDHLRLPYHRSKEIRCTVKKYRYVPLKPLIFKNPMGLNKDGIPQKQSEDISHFLIFSNAGQDDGDSSKTNRLLDLLFSLC
jgi:hypothetical protein